MRTEEYQKIPRFLAYKSGDGHQDGEKEKEQAYQVQFRECCVRVLEVYPRKVAE